MTTTAFFTRFLKNNRFDAVLRRLSVFCLCLFLLQGGSRAGAAELEQLRASRSDNGIYLSAVVAFDLRPVVEDALSKGIPLFFVAEADIYRDRWYWIDRRVASATRTIRLSFQPLTRRWRVNIVTGLINNSAGLRATLNQNYDSLPEALSAVQRLSRWKIADISEVDADVSHKLEFRFRLDLSQLPRPFQIGVAGQKDWTITVDVSEPLRLQRDGADAAVPQPLAPVLTNPEDKAKAGPAFPPSPAAASGPGVATPSASPP